MIADQISNESLSCIKKIQFESTFEVNYNPRSYIYVCLFDDEWDIDKTK